jgi:hypothetical protein
MMNESELTELFRKLGARNPAGWAHSQVTEDKPQLGRFLFLRQAWNAVVAEDDRSWLAQALARRPDGPGGAIVPALERLRGAGVSEQDLTDVVRVMQWQLLFRICYLLGDPGDVEAEVRHVQWQLFQVDENFEPVEPLGLLHESVLETEPSGREMKPRGSSSP